MKDKKLNNEEKGEVISQKYLPLNYFQFDIERMKTLSEITDWSFWNVQNYRTIFLHRFGLRLLF